MITKENWEEQLGRYEEELKQISDQLNDLVKTFHEIAYCANNAGYTVGRIHEGGTK